MTPKEANLGHRSHKEWLEGHNPAIVDEIYAPDCVLYANHIPRVQRFGREGFKAYGAFLYTAFPDMKINHDMVITEEGGQYQTIVWTFEGTHLGPMGAIPPTGRKVVLHGLDIFRIANGLIQELYLGQDALSLMQQLGVVPEAPASASGPVIDIAPIIEAARSREAIPVKANLYDRFMSSRRSEELANKSIIARYVEATNAGELDTFNEFVAPDYIEHEPMPGQGPGREELKKAYVAFNGPFPDLNYTFEDLIAEGDLVVGRGVITGTHKGEFFGIPGTGKKIRWTGTRLFRLKDGKVTEGWINLDMLGMMQQMGVIPAPPQPSAPPPPARKITGAPSTRAANRARMEIFIDMVWNQGNLHIADQMFHPEHTSPSAPTLPPGPEGTKMIVNMFRTAFPDFHMTIDQMVAEDDRVAARFIETGTHLGDLMGIPPTGKKVSFSEIGILRIADGKIVESWYDVDMLGLMQQLGVGGS